MIDEATIKRVFIDSGLDRVEYEHKDAAVKRFARAIEQLARQEQREEDARILDALAELEIAGGLLTDKGVCYEECAEAIRTAALPVAGEKGDGK